MSHLLRYAVASGFLCTALLSFGQEVSAGLMSGETSPKINSAGTLQYNNYDLRFVSDQKTLLSIPTNRVSVIRYSEQRKIRSWWILFPPVIVVPETVHCLTVEYTDDSKTPHNVVFRLGKADFEKVAADISAATGKTVQNLHAP